MKTAVPIIMAFVLVPLLALAAVLSVTVVKVDKDKQEIVVKTETGRETVAFSSNTKGAEKSQEGSRVTISHQPSGDQLLASEFPVSGSDIKTSPSESGDAAARTAPSERPNQPSVPPVQQR